ncbi:MAG: PilZ domain-containing protein [Nitrospira sp.]|nr:MAG: PilZ domain-containing protein [Nitrospira sp.]
MTMEQRENIRFPVKFRSSFSSTGRVGGEGRVVDLSIRGCRIESPIEVQPGATLEVQIQAIEHEPPILIQAAIVRWRRERQFGLEFEVIVPTEWAHLQKFVKQLEMEPYLRDKQSAEFGGAS